MMTPSSDILQAIASAEASRKRVPQVIRRLMRLFDLTETDAAEAFGVTRQTINNRLVGRTPIPCTEEPGWALFLKVPVEVLHGSPDEALRWVVSHPSDLLLRGTAWFTGASRYLTTVINDEPVRAA